METRQSVKSCKSCWNIYLLPATCLNIFLKILLNIFEIFGWVRGEVWKVAKVVGIFIFSLPPASPSKFRLLALVYKALNIPFLNWISSKKLRQFSALLQLAAAQGEQQPLLAKSKQQKPLLTKSKKQKPLLSKTIKPKTTSSKKLKAKSLHWDNFQHCYTWQLPKGWAATSKKQK